MSYEYVGYECLSMMTDIIARYGDGGYSDFGFDLSAELKEVFDFGDNWGTKEKVFQMLRQMNVDAIKANYDDYEELIDDIGYDPGCDIWEEREFEDGHEKLKPWHYKLLKALHYYIYNSSHLVNYDTELYKGIEEYIHLIEHFIACNQTEYVDTSWIYS